MEYPFASNEVLRLPRDVVGGREFYSIGEIHDDERGNAISKVRNGSCKFGCHGVLQLNIFGWRLLVFCFGMR